MHRSACASSQSDQGLHCPLIESMDTTGCMNEEQWPLSKMAVNLPGPTCSKLIS